MSTTSLYTIPNMPHKKQTQIKWRITWLLSPFLFVDHIALTLEYKEGKVAKLSRIIIWLEIEEIGISIKVDAIIMAKAEANILNIKPLLKVIIKILQCGGRVKRPS